MPLFSREMAIRLVAIFLPLVTVTGLIVLALYRSQDVSHRTIMQANEQGHVQLQTQIIDGDFRSILADVMIVARSRELAMLLAEPTPANRQNLAEECQLFLEQKQLYDQARYLDTEGKEVVRVNLRSGRAEIVPTERLQQKGDRYYVRETLELKSGELFMSPFDLNVEEGQIEQPIKPTIRFATPVHDSGGTIRGIVVLNYLGSRLLDKITSASASAAGQVMLLDDFGHWLKGASPDDEWGFMFEDKRHLTLANRFPDAWREMLSADDGQFETADGMWTFRTVYPLARLQPGRPLRTSNSAGSGPYSWKIVSHVPNERLLAEATRLQGALVRLFLALVVVLFTVSWLGSRLLLQHKQAQDQLLQSERLAAIGEAMAALSHESRNALQRSQAGLDMLAKRVADRPEAVELLGEVQDAQYFLRDMYEEVRDYSAPMNLHEETVDLRRVVDETWDHLVQARRGRPIELRQTGRLPDATAWADAQAVSQVFRNLFQNAIEASPAVSRIEVEYDLDRIEHCPAVRVAVRDNGPGLSREQRERIFEPFFTTKSRGTGLGMAICKRIIDAHGGRIEVGSKNGTGAEIVLILPQMRT
jgi:signal transduction histidine kinase